ncbi:MAG: DUF3168 domain-containing protein [Janthinobacterium lividum]
MEAGQLLFSLLKQAAPVVALVGTKIYPLVAPQGKPRPYICYQVIDQIGNATMTCDLDDDARVQVSIFADTYDEVCAISQATRKALHGQRLGPVVIDFDGNHDHHDDRALCYFRSQDYLLEGLTP